MINFLLLLKGFAMGLADIVPGVSGGTIAFVTGIYDELLSSISSVNKEFVKLLLKLKIKDAFEYINGKFLVTLGFGIASAILLTSRLMHYLLHTYPDHTWGLFFGLILASIFYISKSIEKPFKSKHVSQFLFGTIVGVALVSLIPVSSENSYLNIFLSGSVAICAMILPGISGSFILLILGKYAFITGALKAPFNDNNLIFILIFCVGCFVGILSFSKLLNFLMHKYHQAMITILTGFMFGSLKKIWPWKEVLESVVIRNKTHVLEEANILPDMSSSTIFTILFMLIGFGLVFLIEFLGKKKN
jgi:putative membrane protein